MRFLFFPVAANSRLLSLLETISEALLRETFLWGCVGVIIQANSLLFYWLSKSRGPRYLSRNTAHSGFLSLVSCDQKQISNMLDLKTQVSCDKIVSLKLPHTEDFLNLGQKSHVATIKICRVRLALDFTGESFNFHIFRYFHIFIYFLHIFLYFVQVLTSICTYFYLYLEAIGFRF